MNKNIEIIPAILVNSFEEFTEKVKLVEDYTNRIHLDVADGDFAPSRSWGDPVQVHDFDTSVSIEAHLMVQEPEKVIDDWLTGRSEERDSGISRIYFHWEATSQHIEIIKKIKSAGKEAGIAILPETPLDLIKLEDELVDAVMIFAGNLGYYGGKFSDYEKATLDKISALRQMHPDLIIEVDGGMNPETAKKAVSAGANAIVSGSYIWRHPEGPTTAIKELEEAVKME
ncbi:MAG: hypothetical protein WD712_02285 [Candidatus Spechtbacterales bacterium]